jgi:hypothetical protein
LLRVEFASSSAIEGPLIDVDGMSISLRRVWGNKLLGKGISRNLARSVIFLVEVRRVVGIMRCDGVRPSRGKGKRKSGGVTEWRRV